MTEGEPASQLQFRRLVTPRSDGRVKVVLECRLAGRLLGRIVQVGSQRWQFRPVSGPLGEVCRTAEEVKRGVGELASELPARLSESEH